MKVVAFAYHNMGITGLEALKKENFDIQAVISHHNTPEENCWFGSVVQWSKRNGIPVYCPANVNTPEWINKIRDMSPDVIFSFYYRQILSDAILAIPSSGAYNLHGSLLPAYRGRCPANWVLVNGESSTGVTLHHMVKRADAGDIVGQKEIPIEYEDTAFTLHEKLCRYAKELLSELLPLIKNHAAPHIPQNLSAGSYYGGRRPEDGKIDWTRPVTEIYNLIRAVTYPYPGAFTFLPDGEKLFIWWGKPEPGNDSEITEGALQAEGEDIYVQSSDGRLKLIDIEVADARLKGHEIFNYFKRKKGLILK